MKETTLQPAGLAQLQAELASAVGGFAGAWPRDVLGRVVPGGSLDEAGALDVYRVGYVARLTEQLGEMFPSVWRVLGDDDFLAACERYIAGHRSDSYNLSDYGREFPAFLAALPLPEELSFLEELAAFELEFHDLFHADMAEMAGDADGAARLAASGELAGARLAFIPAFRLLALRRAVYDVFLRRHDADALLPVTDRPQWMMIYRRGAEVMALEVGEGTFAALQALLGGATVDEALDAALQRDPAFGEDDAQRLFATLVASGVVAHWTA